MNRIQSYRDFWETNEKCMTLGEDIPRVPVDIFLNGDWVCDYLGIDCARYYTDYEFQRDMRLKASEDTERELGHVIQPNVDFGVVMDASVYGGEPMYESKATPVLKPVINDPEEIDAFVERMKNVNLLEAGMIPRYLAWREKIRAQFGVTLKYGTSLKGCATMMGQICGITNFLTWIMTDQEQMHKLADCWYETSVRYLDAMRAATGVDGQGKFSFASDVAGMLPPRIYNAFIKEKERKLYERYAGNTGKRYYHADYHMMHLLPYLREIGVNEVNIDPYVDCEAILELLPGAVIYGQIPPTDILLYGSREQVRECVARDINQAGKGKNLIVCTAGSINPGTSFENLRAVCEAVEEFGYIY